MNTIELTNVMKERLNEKIDHELKNLEAGYSNLDFEKVFHAAKALNLVGHRGYDLAVETGPAYFDKRVRKEFLENIQSDFQANGIELLIQEGSDSYYFSVFGERLGALYPGHRSINGQKGVDKPDFLDKIWDSRIERLQTCKEDKTKYESKVEHYTKLRNDPSLIRNSEFQSLILRDKDETSKEIEGTQLLKKSTGIFSRYQLNSDAKKVEAYLQTAEGIESIENMISGMKRTLEYVIVEIEHLEKLTSRLENHQSSFRTTMDAFYNLLKKYNIPLSVS